MPDLLERLELSISQTLFSRTVSNVCGFRAGKVKAWAPKSACVGDRVRIKSAGRETWAEVVGLHADQMTLLPDTDAHGVSVGDPVVYFQATSFRPDKSWIGRILDPEGTPLDGRPVLPGLVEASCCANTGRMVDRRPLGPRIHTGFAVFDTMLPLVRGQRIGLFAGSGVGKSTLLAGLAVGVEVDVVVIGLIGERSREVLEFANETLGAKGMERAVIIAATSDQPARLRRKCAQSATAVAEYFRDLGLQVLLLLDSVTRFTEAHREISCASGEQANMRGFPPSTAASIARLCERAGPGSHGTGDITAVYTVLVAGSDFDEPVSDMLRGVLDGHVILDRAIAERGRFPAVDVLRSVSRSLPKAANEYENAIIGDARKLLAAYDQSEAMIQSGLYSAGGDPQIDRAIAVRDGLETFFSRIGPTEFGEYFEHLRAILEAGQPEVDQAS